MLSARSKHPATIMMDDGMMMKPVPGVYYMCARAITPTPFTSSLIIHPIHHLGPAVAWIRPFPYGTG